MSTVQSDSIRELLALPHFEVVCRLHLSAQSEVFTRTTNTSFDTHDMKYEQEYAKHLLAKKDAVYTHEWQLDGILCYPQSKRIMHSFPTFLSEDAKIWRCVYLGKDPLCIRHAGAMQLCPRQLYVEICESMGLTTLQSLPLINKSTQD